MDNFCPLSFCSSDLNDKHGLTPNHFLYGQIAGQLAPRVIKTQKSMAVYRRSHQQVLEKTDEGIPVNLNTRNKWVEDNRKIASGHVVPMVITGHPVVFIMALYN